MQKSDERNFHIFYMICAAAPETLRHKLGLNGNPDNYAVSLIEECVYILDSFRFTFT